jgi:hypothetical protein
MTRSGVPDYGMYAALENMGKLVDSGELAARLGSIVTFNREGNVIFWDDFERTPLKWEAQESDPGSSAKYSDETALFGGQCVKLVTGNVIGYTAGICRTFPRFTDGKEGIEIAFKNESQNYKFTISGYMKRVTYWFKFEVRVDFNVNKIELYADDSQWHDIVTGIEFSSEGHLFHSIKLVLNEKDGTYVRLLINRHEYNIEDYGIPYQVFPTNESFQVRFEIETYETEIAPLYLDNFILTQNEP